jgi:hypothetical protein
MAVRIRASTQMVIVPSGIELGTAVASIKTFGRNMQRRPDEMAAPIAAVGGNG